jgi:hypothetical protein
MKERGRISHNENKPGKPICRVEFTAGKNTLFSVQAMPFFGHAGVV